MTWTAPGVTSVVPTTTGTRCEKVLAPSADAIAEVSVWSPCLMAPSMVSSYEPVTLSRKVLM